MQSEEGWDNHAEDIEPVMQQGEIGSYEGCLFEGGADF